MPGQRPILAMSFIASLGITFDVLACTLPRGQANFWPLLVFIFYILLPIPMIFARRIIKETPMGMNESSASRIRDYALFFTAGLATSSMALPIILTRTPNGHPIISPLSCFLIEIGNVLCYATIGLFFIYFKTPN